MDGRFQVRRATLDDLPSLKAMWLVARLPFLDLERRLTEFQLVGRPDGVLMGAIGFRVAGHHGLIHSEAVYSPGQAAEFLPVLWERLRVLAKSQQVARLWMKSNAGEFWRGLGFRPATPNELRLLPADFAAGRSEWLTLALRDETLLPERLAQQLEALHEAELENANRLRHKALILKWIASLIVIGFLGGTLFVLLSVLRSTRGRRRSSP